MKSPINKTINFDIRFLLLISMLFCVSLHASERKELAIERAINAYGGDHLLGLKRLHYRDLLLHFFEHQSGHNLQGPSSQHLNQIRLEVRLDFASQRGELKRQTELLVGYHDSHNVTATHRIYQDGKGYNIDHFLQTFQVSKRFDIDNVDLGYSQMLDPLIVRKLASERTQALWVDSAFIQGKAHDVLIVNQGKNDEYTVYIDRATGMLSRMLQQRGSIIRTYDFLEHQIQSIIPWAKRFMVSANGSPIYHSNSRELRTGDGLEVAFRVPAHYQKAEPVEPYNVSNMTIRALANGVYFVGKEWGYTLFVDAGDYYVSAGAWGMEQRSDDWLKALELLYQTTAEFKPVKLHLVSHHHTDHMSELHDVLDHGARILSHSTDVNSIKSFLSERAVADQQFVEFSPNMTIANDRVLILDVPSSQASHNLVMYLPKEKILFSEDMFGSSLQTGHHSPRAWPHMDTYQRLHRLQTSLQEQRIEPHQYLSSHHGRVLSHGEIEEAMEVSLPSSEVIERRLFQGHRDSEKSVKLKFKQ